MYMKKYWKVKKEKVSRHTWRVIGSVGPSTAIHPHCRHVPTSLNLTSLEKCNSSSNAARRYDDGCHVSRPRCLLQALSWLRMPMRLLQVRPQCRHM